MKQNQIIFRKADSNDNFYEMARLLYETDPYIYPYWQPSVKEFANFLAPWMNADGFIFNFRNFYIAHECNNRFPLAIMVALSNRSNCDFDYAAFTKHVNDPRTDFVIEHYLQDIVTSSRDLPDGIAYGVALSVSHSIRGRGIGSGLFEYAIDALKRRGINTFYFDCPKDNIRARIMYEKHGFENVSEGIGFDGTLNSQVKTITYSAGF